eukprot:Stramenopile-MAST_4_protein_5357
MGGNEAENEGEPLTQTGASTSTDPMATILTDETAITASSSTEQNIEAINPPTGQPNPTLSSPGDASNPATMGIPGATTTSGDLQLMPIHTPQFAANMARIGRSWITTTPAGPPRTGLGHYHPTTSFARNGGGVEERLSTGNVLIDTDPDTFAREVYFRIFGTKEFARKADTHTKEIDYATTRLTKLLPQYSFENDEPEIYLQAVEEAIESTKLQNFPSDILSCLRKAFGFGTPKGYVVDGFMQAAKEQARQVYAKQGIPPHQMTKMTSMMNPTAGEFYVVKLLRSVLNNSERRFRKNQNSPHHRAGDAFPPRFQQKVYN